MHNTSLLQQVTLLQLEFKYPWKYDICEQKILFPCIMFCTAAIDNLLPSESDDLIFDRVVTGYCVIKMPIKSIIIYIKIMTNTFLFKIN